LFKQNVGVEQLLESHDLLCWAAKWLDDSEVTFRSKYHDGYDRMVADMHKLLSEADAVITFNGKRFDIPHLNRCFLLAELGPPSPYKQIDLLDTMKGRFRFASNRLKHLSKEILNDSKREHEGHTLWIKCLNNDAEAWDTMREYNIHDVTLTEKLYNVLVPWIVGHPNRGAYTSSSEPTCPRCGSTRLTKQGFAYTTLSRFQQYKCLHCKGWSRVRLNDLDRSGLLVPVAER
jgi:uncharacterized protein YprB with RNaseH-like and TPR domain